MNKHIFTVMDIIHNSPAKAKFHEAMSRGDIEAAHWWNQVDVTALMLGNYNLAEQTDREEAREQCLKSTDQE